MLIENIPQYLNCKGNLVDISGPLIMGIMNLTPDSFYDGGRYFSGESIDRRISEMTGEGMDILDVGACSSRPGADNIDIEEEWARLRPALEIILKKHDNIVVSVDTFRSEIARRAVEDYGVSIVNDISGGVLDDKMPEQIARLRVPYILMHMQGTPNTMQDNPKYRNLIGEIMDFFIERIHNLRTAGVTDIIIDPGFGFGKTLDQNYELLAKLNQLKVFNLPILAGLSRKSMIYNYLGQGPSDALPGTIVLQTVALQKGARILRVHDIKEAVICRKMIEKLKQTNN